MVNVPAFFVRTGLTEIPEWKTDSNIEGHKTEFIRRHKNHKTDLVFLLWIQEKNYMKMLQVVQGKIPDKIASICH